MISETHKSLFRLTHFRRPSTALQNEPNSIQLFIKLLNEFQILGPTTRSKSLKRKRDYSEDALFEPTPLSELYTKGMNDNQVCTLITFQCIILIVMNADLATNGS